MKIKTRYQNLWALAKARLRGQLIALNAHNQQVPQSKTSASTLRNKEKQSDVEPT